MKKIFRQYIIVILSFAIVFSFCFSNCFAMEAAIGSGVAAAGGAALGPVAVGVGVVAGGAYVITHTDEIVQGAKVLMHKINPDKGGKTVAPRVN